MKRKLLSMLICSVLLLVPCSTAFAEENETDGEDLESRIAALEKEVQELEELFNVFLNSGGVTFTLGDASTDGLETGEEDKKDEIAEFNFGETWTVDGEWDLTIESVEETSQRYEYSDAELEPEPAAVYIVTYTYTNLGYDWDGWGLYISLDSGIVDSEGYMGYSYPVNLSYYPEYTPVGAKCKAQVSIGVDNPGDFTINYKAFDDNNEYHSAIFNVPVG